MVMAARNLSLANGDIIWRWAHTPPADWPIITKWSGSPPKEEMCLCTLNVDLMCEINSIFFNWVVLHIQIICTQLIAKAWSFNPQFPDAAESPVENAPENRAGNQLNLCRMDVQC